MREKKHMAIMNTMKKKRVGIAFLGLLLSAIAAFLGGGISGLAFHAYKSGMQAPEMFGWDGAFLFTGLVALIPVTPALLLMLACGIAWRTAPGRHLLLCALLPFLLVAVVVSVFILMKSDEFAFIVAAVICLSITAVVELFMRRPKR